MDPWLRFALIFAFLGISSELFYYAILLGSPMLEVYLEGIAIVSGAILNLLGQEVDVLGTSIWNGHFMVDIAPECDAVQLCTLLASAILAFPAPWRSKAVGILTNIALLQAVNFIRVVSLYIIGAQYSEDTFHTAHLVIWPGILIVAVVTMWVNWARRVGREADDEQVRQVDAFPS